VVPIGPDENAPERRPGRAQHCSGVPKHALAQPCVAPGAARGARVRRVGWVASRRGRHEKPDHALRSTPDCRARPASGASDARGGVGVGIGQAGPRSARAVGAGAGRPGTTMTRIHAVAAVSVVRTPPTSPPVPRQVAAAPAVPDGRRQPYLQWSWWGSFLSWQRPPRDPGFPDPGAEPGSGG
jgi:hypothetical protein